MELQDLDDLYRKLKAKQAKITTNYIFEHIGRHKLILDLSNKYLFENCIYTFKKLINKTYTSTIPIKELILENCLLTSSSACSVLSIFLNFQGKISLNLINFGNNSITFTPSLSTMITKVLEKSGKNEGKKIRLQGNIISSGESIIPLMKNSLKIKSLSLYDCYLQPETLEAISDALSHDKNVKRLDLSYNPCGLSTKQTVRCLGVALGLNTHLLTLKISGIQHLANKSLLNKLCLGLRNSQSLNKLVIGNIPLGDGGLKILRKKCLLQLPLQKLDIQNNNISSRGIIKLFSKLPPDLIKFVASYNNFYDNKVLMEMGKALALEKGLRNLDLSYCLNLQTAEQKSMFAFCKGVTENRSLCELIMEGCKIQDDPDEFCRLLSNAIEDRKYPISFRISAVKSPDGYSSSYLSKTQDRILKDLTP